MANEAELMRAVAMARESARLLDTADEIYASTNPDEQRYDRTYDHVWGHEDYRWTGQRIAAECVRELVKLFDNVS